MVKKAKVFKPGDYVFAKVKGYPAWPAKVVALNGKKYNIHFFGTGETGNLPANDLFDYFEHKAQFLAKAIKRRDYNDGMAEIDGEVTESGITSNSGSSSKEGADVERDTSVTNQSNAMDTSTDMDTMNETAPSESEADVSKSAQSKASEPQSDKEAEDVEMAPAVSLQTSTAEDSAEESSQKGTDDSATVEEMESLDTSTSRAGKGKRNTPAVKTPQPVKTHRRGAVAAKQDVVPEAKTPAPDGVSRSGRKIKPKRYLDEETEESPVPAAGAKRSKLASQSGDDEVTTSVPTTPQATVATPAASVPISKAASAKKALNGDLRKIGGRFRYINQSELACIQEPFTRDNTDSSLGQQQKDNILIAFLPNGKPVGIKLFMDRPETFATPAVRLQWENKAAKNYIKLKQQLESGEVKPESLLNQLVSDLKLTDDEISMMKKERDLDIQRNQLNFLRVEAKLLELENQMRSALGFTGADAALGVKCLQQINALEIRPLMLLKHPSILETIKRTRHYVGKGDDLTEAERDEFNIQAHEIRKLSEQCFNSCKMMFKVEEGKKFLETFSMLVLRFKKCIKNMTEMEIMEMYEEPPEMSQLGAYSLTLDEGDESADKDREKGGTPERILSPAQDNASLQKTPSKKIAESTSKSPKKDKPK